MADGTTDRLGGHLFDITLSGDLVGNRAVGDDTAIGNRSQDFPDRLAKFTAKRLERQFGNGRFFSGKNSGQAIVLS